MNVIDAAHAIVHDYPGGSIALAPRLGMSAAILRGKVNPNDSGHHLTVEESLRMQQLTGNHAIYLAETDELGYVAILKPQIGGADDDVAHALTRMCSEFGDYLRKVDESMKDGKVTTTERRQLEQELSEMIAAATHLQAVLAGKTGKAPR